MLFWGALLAGVSAIVGVAFFSLMLLRDQTYVPSRSYSPKGEPDRTVAVAYYSRSGHSEAVAREIARTLNAPIARIEADYALDVAGQQKAVSDANAGALPRIAVEPVDVTPARRIFLVSPIWMYRPSAPLWAYVEQTDFSGKQVVLVTTGNSRFKQEEIDRFATRLEARGGQLTRHVFLRRGRIYWQLSREELLQRARALALEFARTPQP